LQRKQVKDGRNEKKDSEDEQKYDQVPRLKQVAHFFTPSIRGEFDLGTF